ncbi:Gfo/Idh/MocA family protein [Aquirufa ecclesiirivi]|uniref:Gfo/Idh/MocA family protein n=1 Tax=Aquirufa ecclesiirivi TaxID=2715124 RepID=UPI0014079713|nr:Gfo/Idh/MocA family oxidoreductase [Aquirufa ecclesiirivi]MCZ2472695.1 Gfo/Idh/MocA family oxidoreductase [Aquirufa ecclesiirivi]MDF0694198.1 Gfo/Idh/MocA family oxidoreductase [Aquirufa ecclesiirivi]NHC49741.1 Gfo/Idh/MocA family oxidoreductase [Aquirufa ecclesiirivi]
MGMIGGSLEAFIGAVHRRGSQLDGEIELVCGAFSSSAEKSKATGAALYLEPSRVYGSYEEMILQEKALPEGERMDFVSIVTPNHLHFPAAKMALENGFHVVCDKPATLNLDEAKELKKVIEASGLIFALTHNYTGYPMIKEAKHLVDSGELGEIRKVIVEYPQGWLIDLVEATGQKQAAWRTDPARCGAAGAVGDIGTHAENLAEYITGLHIDELCADLTIFVDGRQLDDDGNILIHYNNGARGVLHCSQICNGEENDLNIRVYGSKAGIVWHQMDPNTLIIKSRDGGSRTIRTNVGNLSAQAQAHTRQPAGHPEGYVETFANIYRNFAFALRARWEGKEQDPLYDFPGIDEGIKGMAFIENVVRSSKDNTNKWTKFEI